MNAAAGRASPLNTAWDPVRARAAALPLPRHGHHRDGRGDVPEPRLRLHVRGTAGPREAHPLPRVVPMLAPTVLFAVVLAGVRWRMKPRLG